MPACCSNHLGRSTFASVAIALVCCLGVSTALAEDAA
jgi:hypothetical protein